MENDTNWPEILADYKKGMKTEEIFKKHAIPRGTFYSTLKRKGITPRDPKAAKRTSKGMLQHHQVRRKTKRSKIEAAKTALRESYDKAEDCWLLTYGEKSFSFQTNETPQLWRLAGGK